MSTKPELHYWASGMPRVQAQLYLLDLCGSDSNEYTERPEEVTCERCLAALRADFSAPSVEALTAQRDEARAERDEARTALAESEIRRANLSEAMREQGAELADVRARLRVEADAAADEGLRAAIAEAEWSWRAVEGGKFLPVKRKSKPTKLGKR